MSRCEMERITKSWTRPRCKRNATTTVDGKHVCEQHAKILLGLPDSISGVPAVERVTWEGHGNEERRAGAFA